MAEDWYVGWAREYMALFGMATAEDAAMLKAWRRVFELDGVTEAELRAATDHLASRDVPAKKWEHLPRLQAYLQAQRAERTRLRDEGYEDFRCQLCGGTGYAVVPHPRTVVGREWHRRNGCWYTCAVTCECQRGLDIYRGCVEGSIKGGTVAPLTLADYKRRNPWWLQQLARRDEAQAAALEAYRATRAAEGGGGPDTFADTLARIRRRVRGREPGEEG